MMYHEHVGNALLLCNKNSPVVRGNTQGVASRVGDLKRAIDSPGIMCIWNVRYNPLDLIEVTEVDVRCHAFAHIVEPIDARVCIADGRSLCQANL